MSKSDITLKSKIGLVYDWILRKILYVCCPLRLHYLSAFILFLKTRNLKDNNSPFCILVFGKPVFNEDINSVCKNDNRYSYYCFPRLYLKIICSYFLNGFDKTNDANYHLFISNKKQIVNLRKYLKNVFRFYFKLRPTLCTISGNFVYTQMQELFIVLKDLKIRNYVIYKEGLFPIASYKRLSIELYKTKKFRADHIFLINEHIRKCLINSPIDNITTKNSTVVGIPRLDEYKAKTNESIKYECTLFGFEPSAKSSYLLTDKRKTKEFDRFVTKLFESFLEYCVENPQKRFVIKVKPQKGQLEYFVNLTKAKFNQINNLTISSSIPVKSLIKKSGKIICYSSTVSIEAMLNNKQVLCPNLSEFLGKENDLITPYNSLVDYFSCKQDLVKLIKQSKSTRDSGELHKFLIDRITTVDFDSGRRIMDFIHKIESQ